MRMPAQTTKIALKTGVLAASLAVVVCASAGIPPFKSQWAGAILLGFGLAWAALYIHSVTLKILVAAVALAETIVLSWLLHQNGIEWSPSTALAAGIFATGFGMAYSLSKPGCRKRRVEELFGGRVSLVTLQRLLESDEPLPLAGEKREASVLECHLANCRALVEKLDAPGLVEFTNRLSDCTAQALMDSGGVIVERRAGHLRAVFGAPLADPAHAARAREAASLLKERLKPFRQECMEKWGVEPGCKVSVHSGAMIVGFFASGGFDVVPTGE